MPASPLQAAKRAFVSVLLFVARYYGLALPVTRDTTDDALLSAFKKVALKAHPDKGGSHDHAQRLNDARSKWLEARAASKPSAQDPKHQGPTTPTASSDDGLATLAAKGFRIQSLAVLLTYQGLTGLGQWSAFVHFVQRQAWAWNVRRWSATLESMAGCCRQRGWNLGLSNGTRLHVHVHQLAESENKHT